MESSVSEIRAGTVIGGKYVVERELGSGAVGIVVEAVHRQLEDRVAIKVMSSAVTPSEDGRARFLREARAAAKLKNEHVARVIDVGSMPDGQPYIVMEFLAGQELSMILENEGPLASPRAVEYVLQVCEGLAEAHGFGIVHRDLKPSNLFVTQRVDGSSLLKLLDFGVAKTAIDARTGGGGESLTKTRTVLGSPAYMSPEQIRSSRSVDARTDIWSLGVVLYQLLTNELPFMGESVHEVLMSIIEDDPVPLRERRPNLPEELAEVVERCLRKDRDERFPDVAHLAEALAPFAPAESRVSVTGIANTLGISLRRAGAVSSSRNAEIAAMATTVHAPGSPHLERVGARPRARISRAGLVVVVAIAVVVAVIVWPRTPPPSAPRVPLPQRIPAAQGPAVEPVSVAAAPIATVVSSVASAASAAPAPPAPRVPLKRPVESRPPVAPPPPRGDGGVLDETVETRL